MSFDHPNELQRFREKPLSPHVRWLEVVCRTVVELYRLQSHAELLAKAFPDKPDVFHAFEQETLQNIEAIVCEGLGWRITHNTDMPVPYDGNRFVYISNHPTLTAVWPWSAFMQKHFAGNIVAVGKRSIIKNPLSRLFLGNLMLMTRKGIFINREDREEAIREIGAYAASILTPGTGAVIFPDEHRPYPRRIRGQQRQWDLKQPRLEVGRWMTDTCFPKSGGLWELGQTIHGLEHVRFLDCTIVEPSSVYRFGGELYIDVREISRAELFGSPESEDHLRKKLIELWQRKNGIIRNRRLS